MNSSNCTYRNLALLVTSLCVLSVVADISAAGETIEDREAGFTLTVPDGFEPIENLSEVAPAAAYGYLNGDPTDEEIDVFLLVERMRGTIGRDPLKASDLPPGFQGRVFKEEWRGFAIDAFEVPEKAGEIDFVTFNVQFPLKPKAVQIKLAGPRAREAELRRWLGETVASVEGPTNWSHASVSHRFTESQFRVFLLALAGTIFVIGLGVYWLISKYAPKGAVLGSAVLIWLAGNMLEKIGSREAMTAGGTLKLLGTAGVILGLIDLFRRRGQHAAPDRANEPAA